jgi:hypothetical protein
MKENAAAALSVICSAYSASFVPPSLDIDWTDSERANRGFVAIGLAGENSLFRGAQRILEHLDALCRVCSTKKITTLVKNPLLEDLAPRTLGLVAPDCEAELVPHLQWLVAVINGKAGDITSTYSQDPQAVFESLSRLCKSSVSAYVFVREAMGARPVAPVSSDSAFMATRLGIVSWTETVLDERGAHTALRQVLDEYEDALTWEALEWFAAIQCGTVAQRCVTCPVNMDCEALGIGAT